MKKILKIIKEEYRKLIKEFYSDEQYFDWEDEVTRSIFNTFLNQNNETFTRYTPWQVILFPRLKKFWEDYMKIGVIRDTKGLDMIEKIIISNTIKVNLFTNLAGHTQSGGEDIFEEYIGYYVNEQLNCLLPNKKEDRSQLEIPFNNPSAGYVKKEPAREVEPCNVQVNSYIQNYFNENYEEGMSREKIYEIIYEHLKDLFLNYYIEDPKTGQAYISDYGLKPLMSLMYELTQKHTPEEKLLVIDKMLNVVHMRSDIAAWFVEGGSHALSQLSGYYHDDTGDSNISGKYRMSDYN